MTNPVGGAFDLFITGTLPVSNDILWDSIGSDPEAVERCLRAGISPEQIRNGITPLVAACRVKDFQSIKSLVNAKANINFQYSESEHDKVKTFTILLAMCRASYAHPNCDEMIEWLVDHGADHSIKDNSGRTALHYAVRKGINTTRILLDKGADPNVVDEDERTPFALLLDWDKPLYDKEEAMKLLLQKRPDFPLLNEFNDSSVFGVLYFPNVLRWLLCAGGNPNIIFNDGYTPLMFLIRNRINTESIHRV